MVVVVVGMVVKNMMMESDAPAIQISDNESIDL